MIDVSPRRASEPDEFSRTVRTLLRAIDGVEAGRQPPTTVQDRIDAAWEHIRVIDEEAAVRVRDMPRNDSADRLDWHERPPSPSIPAHELGGHFGFYVPLPVRRQAALAELQAERAELLETIRILELNGASA